MSDNRNVGALYRALDFEYRHPPTIHPTRRQGAGRAHHSCLPVSPAMKRRAKLQQLLAESPKTSELLTNPVPAPDSSTSEHTIDTTHTSSCTEPPARKPEPSRLQKLAEGVRKSRREPPVQGADLDRVLTSGRHPLHEEAQRLVARLKDECATLQLPATARAGTASQVGRSVMGSIRQQRAIGSATGAEYDRERRRRMFSMLYK